MRSAVVVVSIVLAAASASAQPVDLSGDYNGTWGRTTLHQFGDHVIGMYRNGRGTLDGTIADGTLRFAWREGASVGRGAFAIAGDGSLAGTWGYGEDDRGGGAWLLTRVPIAQPGAIIGTSGGVHVDASLGLFTPPRHTWSFGYRFFWDASGRAGMIGMGVGGFGLEIERRLGERWHLGITGDLTETLVLNSMSGPDSYQRLRGGVALRRDLDDKRHRWVGLRGGIQTIDGGATTGQFAELAIGTDWYLGGMSMGVYMFTGADRERTTATGTMSPTSTARVTAPGDTMGWNAGFGMRITH